MAILIAISVPFAVIAFLVRRPWTVALPIVVWLAIAGLGAAGVLSRSTSIESAIAAGVFGAFFAVAGLVLGERSARRRPGP
jgi:hypothetical protein